MKKDTQNHKFPKKLKGDWDLIGQQQPEPNDPILKHPAMKGRRWTIDYGYDSGKTFSKLKERFAMANNDTYVDTDHNDWDVSYNEFYEHLLKEVKLKGGVGDATAPHDVDPVELSMGQTVEMEHTVDTDIATEIALDHLFKDPKYYSKLKKAGLSDELSQVNTSSGFGDPEHPINDRPRLGSDITCTPGNNIVGTAGNTPDGHIEGLRGTEPIINKSVEIDIQEPEYDDLAEAVLAEKKKKGKRKPKPTNSSLWSRAKAAARSKFDVYPSAYANAWAAKWYKKNGGKWRMGECTGDGECNCGCK